MIHFHIFFCYSIIFLKVKSKKDKANIANGPYLFFKQNYLFFLQEFIEKYDPISKHGIF